MPRGWWMGSVSSRCAQGHHHLAQAICIGTTTSRQEGRQFAVYLFVHTKHSKKAGPFSVARLKMDLPLRPNGISSTPLLSPPAGARGRALHG